MQETLQETDYEEEEVNDTASISASTESTTVHEESRLLSSAADRVVECPVTTMVICACCGVLEELKGTKFIL